MSIFCAEKRKPGLGEVGVAFEEGGTVYTIPEAKIIYCPDGRLYDSFLTEKYGLDSPWRDEAPNASNLPNGGFSHPAGVKLNRREDIATAQLTPRERVVLEVFGTLVEKYAKSPQESMRDAIQLADMVFGRTKKETKTDQVIMEEAVQLIFGQTEEDEE